MRVNRLKSVLAELPSNQQDFAATQVPAQFERPAQRAKAGTHVCATPIVPFTKSATLNLLICTINIE
jgi:hypothetical protein